MESQVTETDDGEVPTSVASDVQQLVNHKEGQEKQPQTKFNLIRMTKADLEKFSNFDSNDVPVTIEKTTAFIKAFIKTKQDEKKQRSIGTERQLNQQGPSTEHYHEAMLELMNLDPEVNRLLQTNKDDFSLMIFHSKSKFTCKVQEFTKTLVDEKERETIIANKWSSSFIYFFYRILEETKLPEIFIITIGQLWRIANELADESFSNSIKEKDLEEETVYKYNIHTDGGKLFSTAQHARSGKTLDSSTTSPGTIMRKSTHFTKDAALINKQTGFKRGSKVHIGTTNLSCSLTLSIENIHRFIQYIAETSGNYQSKKEEKIQKVKNIALIDRLNKELMNQLTEKNAGGDFCSRKHFQHEDAMQWNKATELTLFIPDSKKDSKTKYKSKRYNIPLSFREVIVYLTKQGIPQSQWLQIKTKWSRNKEPEALKHFLEDYVILDGIFYRYLFGQWLKVTYEYIAEIDVQFKEVLKECFLKASEEFPILPWKYRSKDEMKSESSEAAAGKKTNQNGSSAAKRTKKTSQPKSSGAKKARKAERPGVDCGSNVETSQSIAPSQSINVHVPGSHPLIPPTSSRQDELSDKQATMRRSTETADLNDSGKGTSQTLSLSTNYSISVDASLVDLPEEHTMTNNHQMDAYMSDSEVDNSISMTLETVSDSGRPNLPVATLDFDCVTTSSININIGEVCKDITKRTEMNRENDLKSFDTKVIEMKKDIEIIHAPIKVDFKRIIRGQTSVEDGKKIEMSYSAKVSKKKTKATYVETKGTKEDLEDLLFLRLCTEMSEGEYNDSYMLYRKLLDHHEKNRFIIIPGDELFVRDSNTELYDVLISDEEKKITYVIQVKAGLKNTTRDACSQIRLSAQKIMQSLLYSSSKSVLQQYWEENKGGPLSDISADYKADVGHILYKMGKEGFLKLFRDEDRRLVFVFGCRDQREKDLQMEYERSLNTDTDESAEGEIRKKLLEECSFSQTQIKEITDTLRQRKILSSSGHITNAYMFQTGNEKAVLVKEIKNMIRHGSKGRVSEILDEVLEKRKAISESDIAKCELIDLEKQFREFRVGRKQFELKICQIPMEFYLKQTNAVVASDASTEIEDIQD